MENIIYFWAADAPDRSVAARALLAQAVGFSAPIAAGEHGKPYFPDHPRVEFSLSHTRGAIVCAVSAFPVGVDVEAADRAFRPALARRCFTAQECAFATDNAHAIAVWTRKEALLKRDGRGVTAPLRTVETTDCPDLATHMRAGFTLSVCGTGAFRVVQITGEMNPPCYKTEDGPLTEVIESL